MSKENEVFINMNKQDVVEMRRVLDKYIDNHYRLAIVLNIWLAIITYYSFNLAIIQGWLSVIMLIVFNVALSIHEKRLRDNIKAELAIRYFITID